MHDNSLRYFIALSLVKKLSHSDAKKLIAEVGSPEMIFKEKVFNLSKLYIKPSIIKQIRETRVLEEADKEMEFIEKRGIKAFCFGDNDYPYRLSQCEDSPLVIYMKGQTDLNAEKIISVVGTRKASRYGLEQCEELISSLASNKMLVVSGLAHGIDTQAHRTAIKNKLHTTAVLGHGLNYLYPSNNRDLATEISQNGCLLTDFPSTNKIIPGNFPSRNRIIAGLSDVCIVVESKITGGSMITADLANSYDREVGAIPGRIGDLNSSGCNFLIKNNEANLIESALDIEELMNWDITRKPIIQKELFLNLNKEEEEIMSILKSNEQMRLDNISLKAGKSLNKTASILLQLEFKNAVKSMPGNIYAAIQ